MLDIVIYEKPTCSTCRQTVQLVKDSGKPFKTVNYYVTPFTKAKLTALLKKGKLSARDVLRTKDDIYKELGLAKKNMPEDDLIDLMVKHPDLIQRPIVEKGEEILLARPAELVKRFL